MSEPLRIYRPFARLMRGVFAGLFLWMFLSFWLDTYPNKGQILAHQVDQQLCVRVMAVVFGLWRICEK